MKIYLDQKQRRLIDAWLARGAIKADGDFYGSFMSAWIAFNAFCYAAFAAEANRPRADLSKGTSLPRFCGKVEASGTFEVLSDGRQQIRLTSPCAVRIDIKERYTEDIVFSKFGKHYQSDFERWRQDAAFGLLCSDLLSAIKRSDNCFFVINPLRAKEYNPDIPLEQLAGKRVVQAITEPTRLDQYIAVLYQVRCNIFHGEKVPGDWNDDRIVKVATPLVIALLTNARRSNGAAATQETDEGKVD